MIEFQSIAKSFDAGPVLDSINFKIDKGERVSLVGPGGCGKTTILKILLGLVEPDNGSVKFLGRVVQKLKPSEKTAIMRKVGVAFQQGGLFDFMTVEENLLFAMEHMTGKAAAQMQATAKDLLDKVKLRGTYHQYPHELSGGMRRRVGIARALCTDPTVAFFDEPTSGLDPVTSTIILNMILDLAAAAKDTTLVVATSNIETAIRFAERVIVIHEGKVVADGPWKELLVSGPPWVRYFLGVRFIGLDLDYAQELQLPPSFIAKHWKQNTVRE